MEQIERIAEAAIRGDALLVRSLVQDFLREYSSLADVPPPYTTDPQVLAVAASLLELFADRANQEAPAWTQQVGPMPEPLFLVKSAESMKRLRVLCEAESPAPLRKRRLYAPPNYLESV